MAMITAPNDWEIKRCLRLSLSLLVAMLGLIGLAALGFDVPVLRQLVGFLFLTFVPGILLLRILKIHNVGIVESLLYSVGLSLAFVMASGVLLNFALPPLGISRPISLVPLTVVLAAFSLILCFLAYQRDRDFSPSVSLSETATQIVKPVFGFTFSPILVAILLPLLAILGALLVNAYENNLLLFAFLFIIVLLIILAAFNKFITPQVYPFLIVMMAIALLYQTTFISSYLVGSDIHFEYYFAKLVVGSGYWDATIPNAVTACLGITILTPVYSLLLNIDGVWLFKIVYPFFFALVPLALFHIFRLQIKPHYAFFATVFFITMPMFTMDMVQLVRQQVATLFFALMILLMVDRKLTLFQRAILVIIFSFGVAVSHYGLGTGVIGYLVLGLLVLMLIKSRLGRTLWGWLVGRSQALPNDLTSPGAFTKKALAIIVGSYLVFTLAFYAVTASGVSLGAPRLLVDFLAGTAKEAIKGITTPPAPVEKPPAPVELPRFVKDITARFPFLDPFLKEPLTQTALGLDFPLASLGGKVWRIFQYLVELCLVVGFFRLLFRPRALGEFKAEYLSLTMVSALVLLGNFTLYHQGYGMGVTRVWFVTLLLMSPLLFFSGEAIGLGIVKLAGIFRRSLASSRLTAANPVLFHSIVLGIMLPYFIFNSGVVFELSRSRTTHFIDFPYSIALSSHRVDLTTVSNKQDIAGAEWILMVADKDSQILADHHVGWFGAQLGGEAIVGNRRLNQYFNLTKEIPSPSYIYLRTRNIHNWELAFTTSYAARQSISFDDLPWFIKAIGESARIYYNGRAQVLLHR